MSWIDIILGDNAQINLRKVAQKRHKSVCKFCTLRANFQPVLNLHTKLHTKYMLYHID
jgi:hypothetical protein